MLKKILKRIIQLRGWIAYRRWVTRLERANKDKFPDWRISFEEYRRFYPDSFEENIWMNPEKDMKGYN